MAFARAVSSGDVRVIDLTQTLSQEFPTIVLPPELGQCAPFRIEEVSRYDERGPAWYWNNISLGEHTGTHFDAPIHWISGKDLPNNAVDTIDVAAIHRAGLRDRLLEGLRRQSGFRADHSLRRGMGGASRQDRAGKLGAAAHRLVEADLSGLCRPARRWRAHAGPGAGRGEVVRRAARRAMASAPRRSAPISARATTSTRPIPRISTCTAKAGSACNA